MTALLHFRRGWRSATQFWEALAILALVLLFGGCASGPPLPPGSRLVVVRPNAQFYKNGPAERNEVVQSTFNERIADHDLGADFSLNKGARLTLVQKEIGFSRVMTEDGVVGYLANEEFAPAPPETRQIVRASLPESTDNHPARRRAMHSGIRPSWNATKTQEPQLDMSDLPPLPIP